MYPTAQREYLAMKNTPCRADLYSGTKRRCHANLSFRWVLRVQ